MIELGVIKRRAIFLFAISVLFLVFVYNNEALYDKPIVKVISVTNEKIDERETVTKQKEPYYMQKIEAKLLNTSQKGEIVALTNYYTYSGVRDEKYGKNDRLFVTIKEDENGSLTGSILNLKKDFYVALMTVFLIYLLLFTSGGAGVRTIISVILNVIIFYFSLKKYNGGVSILPLTVVMIIMFSIITLIMINGFTKVTGVCVISVLATVCVVFGIYYVSTQIGTQPEYILMEHIVSAKDLNWLFMAELLVGGIGAIMDVVISITSTVSELINKDADISNEKLMVSIKELGHDIMGTMINVMFFSFLSGSIPMTILQLKNSYRLTTIISLHLPFEIIRFLIGSIGIVVAIPIAGFFSIKFLGKAVHKS